MHKLEVKMPDRDWNLLTTFFPSNWQKLAMDNDAIKGLRQDKSIEDLLRVLLIHFACGYSLRETVIRAKNANLANMSDVALLKRLRKCKEWLRNLCLSLFAESGIVFGKNKLQFSLFDATHVKEPGKTGSLWRIHYSFQVPDMQCDFFKITKTEGKGNSEDLSKFPINNGDYIIVDRGYAHSSGIAYAVNKGAFVCIRVNQQSLKFMQPSKSERFPMVKHLKKLTQPLSIGSWHAEVIAPENGRIAGRLCVIRKTPEAIKKAYKKVKRKAKKNGIEPKDSTLFLSEYVILFTTFPEKDFSAEEVLEWYRIRWQIELVFKRFKQITNMGHIPKYHDDSAQAWMYGKLFIALLTEKIMRCANSISPWGAEEKLQSLAEFPIYAPSG